MKQSVFFRGRLSRAIALGLWLFSADVLGADAPSSVNGSLPELHRVPWQRSRVIGSPEPPAPYRTIPHYSHLAIPQPIYAAAEPGGQDLFVIELQRGKEPARIHRIADDQHSRSIALYSADRLIYGLAFHPQYQTNRQLYFISNGPVGAKNKLNRISRVTVPLARDAPIDPQSEEIILEWESNGHNGGELGFGPDGMLYCATGDGTSDSDPLQTGQGVNDLLAVMIRIDVEHPTGEQRYSIPPDNPFVNLPGARGEIWAFGFRNPWRMTFDQQQGHLWVTQNGQDLWEQVYLVRRGENYGWSVQEGSHPFYPDRPRGPGEITPPTVEHHHTEARSLTGGVVYYGSRLPELRGTYVYGDYSTGRIWGVRHDGRNVTWHQELCDTPFAIVGFAETPGGELVVIDQHSGFHRLEQAPREETPTTFPRTLTETGLFESVPDHKMAPGVVPYSVNSPLWSDGAFKERFLALPGWSQIDFTPGNAWKLPNGTVLVKTFSQETVAGDPKSRRRIETRLMTRQQNEWAGYSYRWNSDQTEAVLVERGGQDVEWEIQDPAAPGGIRRQHWHIPSRTECMVCHSRAAQFVLGVCTEQLNRKHDYPEGTFQQLDYLSRLGLIRARLSEHPGAAAQWKQMVKSVEAVSTQAEWNLGQLPPSIRLAGGALWKTWREPPQTLPWLGKSAGQYKAFPDPADPAASLNDRVRSYLHVNCSVCHQDAGGGNSQIDLRFSANDDRRKLIDVEPLHRQFHIPEARLVAPGDAERSVLYLRMSRRGRGQMPPLASSLVDPVGTGLIKAWIESLPEQPVSALRALK